MLNSACQPALSCLPAALHAETNSSPGLDDLSQFLSAKSHAMDDAVGQGDDAAGQE